MHNIDPNEMDALFREGADKHEFSYNPDAWAMMEEKLDKKDKRKYFLWLFLGFLLLGGVASAYFLTNVNEQPTPLATSNIEIAGEKKSPLNSENEIGNSAIIPNHSDTKVVKEQTDKQIEAPQVIHYIAQEKSEAKEEYINTISKVRSSNIGAQNSIQSENTGSLVDNEVVSVSSQDAVSAINNETPDIGYNEVVNYTSGSEKKGNVRDLVTIDELGEADAEPLMSIDNTKEEFKLQPSVKPDPIIAASNMRYVMTAFGSSDFSSVGFFSEPQSGFTLGAKFGLQLARKFQIDLGFAYSLKRYGSEGIDYNIEGGWGTMQGVNPTWMDGKGNILQIPLEATYYISGYENNSIFFNAGISSFLLNSEWYGFKYDPEDLLINPNALEEITMDDIPRRNFHLAGVARVSIGYQKVVSPNMTFELAPYLQIPLTGIGEGKVDLYTAGIQFAVKFNTK